MFSFRVSPEARCTVATSSGRSFSPVEHSGELAATLDPAAQRRSLLQHGSPTLIPRSNDDDIMRRRVFSPTLSSHASSSCTKHPTPSQYHTTNSEHKPSAHAQGFNPMFHRRSNSQVSTLSSKPTERRKLMTPFAAYLYRSSFQTVLSVVSSWFYGHYDCTVVAFLLLFTSVLYWHNAVNGWRRYVDMVVAVFASCYHISKAAMCAPIIVFSVYFLGFLCIGYCYHRARECSKEGKWLTSAYFHMFGIHSFGNFCNLLLYAAI